MKIKAFTFIEILISISIVSIIGTYSLYSFFNFYESQNINNKIVEINSIFQEKDRDIKNKKIYDYEIDINKNDKSIIIYTDIYDNNENQKLSYNQNGSGTININKNASDEVYTKIYRGEKLIFTTGSTINSIDFDTKNNHNYKIKSFLSGSISKQLNDIELFQFKNEQEIRDNFITIEKIENNSNQIQNLKIINVNGSRVFFSGATQINNQNLEIFFSDGKNTNSLKIK